MNPEIDAKMVEAIVRQMLSQHTMGNTPERLVPVGVSARHIHLSREDMDTLFGKGSSLTPIKELMGGQYACQEQVTIVGASLRGIEKVRVLGPLRKHTQVEISRTDSFVLKTKPPVRPSGDIEGTPGLTVVGPAGSVTLERGCIIANRHIHMSPVDAAGFGVVDGEMVDCMMEGERRAMFYDVQVRVDPSFTLEMHIDTDDANAVGFGKNPQVGIQKQR